MDHDGVMALQRSVGNAAVLHMLQLAGHASAQHRHGADCGHQQTPATGAPVQRSAVHEVLARSGRPLGAPLREEMESRLGADFSEVRIHEGSAARASAAGVGARAYTSGNHVVIGDSGGDKHTLAHELTHVIQQRQGAVSGTDNGNGLAISDPGDRFEREAEANAHRVMSGPVPRVQRAVGSAAGTGAGHARPSVAAIQRVAAGGHAQGDHVFNALDNTAAQIATSLEARARALPSTLDDATTKAFRKSAHLNGKFKAKYAALSAAVTAVQATAARAGHLGHPHDSSVPHYSFIATLAEDSVAGPDANAATFGAFSRDLTEKAAAAGTEGWALGDLDATSSAWSPFLEARVFDPDAVTKIRNNRLGNGQARSAFNTWLTNTKNEYGLLYFELITAMKALDAFIRWAGVTQKNMYEIEDAGHKDWDRADADTYVPPATET